METTKRKPGRLGQVKKETTTPNTKQGFLYNEMTAFFPIGSIFKTNYGAGNTFELTTITGPCTCAHYLDTINMMGEDLPPTPPHFHFTAYDSRDNGKKRRTDDSSFGHYGLVAGKLIVNSKPQTGFDKSKAPDEIIIVSRPGEKAADTTTPAGAEQTTYLPGEYECIESYKSKIGFAHDKGDVMRLDEHLLSLMDKPTLATKWKYKGPLAKGGRNGTVNFNEAVIIKESETSTVPAVQQVSTTTVDDTTFHFRWEEGKDEDYTCPDPEQKTIYRKADNTEFFTVHCAYFKGTKDIKEGWYPGYTWKFKKKEEIRYPRAYDFGEVEPTHHVAIIHACGLLLVNLPAAQRKTFEQLIVAYKEGYENQYDLKPYLGGPFDLQSNKAVSKVLTELQKPIVSKPATPVVWDTVFKTKETSGKITEFNAIIEIGHDGPNNTFAYQFNYHFAPGKDGGGGEGDASSSAFEFNDRCRAIQASCNAFCDSIQQKFPKKNTIAVRLAVRELELLNKPACDIEKVITDPSGYVWSKPYGYQEICKNPSSYIIYISTEERIQIDLGKINGEWFYGLRAMWDVPNAVGETSEVRQSMLSFTSSVRAVEGALESLDIYLENFSISAIDAVTRFIESDVWGTEPTPAPETLPDVTVIPIANDELIVISRKSDIVQPEPTTEPGQIIPGTYKCTKSFRVIESNKLFNENDEIFVMESWADQSLCFCEAPNDHARFHMNENDIKGYFKLKIPIKPSSPAQPSMPLPTLSNSLTWEDISLPAHFANDEEPLTPLTGTEFLEEETEVNTDDVSLSPLRGLGAESYPGNKHSAGVYQRLINQLPVHDVFVSGFLGKCAVMSHKHPAMVNYGIDPNLEGLKTYWDSLQRSDIQLFRDSFFEWIKKFTFSKATKERWLIYLDPTYLLSTRSSGKIYYDHEMTDEQHADLIKWAIETTAMSNVMIAISHYPCKEYDGLLKHGFRKMTYRVATHNGPVDECLYMNYPEPDELHDYQFFGDDKIKRQAYKRKETGYIEKFQSMPVKERKGILRKLAVQFNVSTPPFFTNENKIAL
jgi:hypothetical protein